MGCTELCCQPLPLLQLCWATAVGQHGLQLRPLSLLWPQGSQQGLCCLCVCDPCLVCKGEGAYLLHALAPSPPCSLKQMTAPGSTAPAWLVAGSGCTCASRSMAGKGRGLRYHDKDWTLWGSSTVHLWYANIFDVQVVDFFSTWPNNVANP